ncbi:MAG: DNA adenine methylase [Paludibacteraceae bacterium]|nr:DNA adenine methylase [Paludibacteraceae bacterium]
MCKKIITKYTPRFNLESRRYIGCKAKLIDWIFGLIQQETHDANSFCDIFAGTGSVSNRAICLFDHVTINDFLYSNHVLYHAFFGVGEWNEEKILQMLNEFNAIDATQIPDNYFSINYGDKYFDYLSARKIGYVRDLIEERKTILSEKEYCVLIASLIYSIDRIANTLGHFEAYRKVKIVPQNLLIKLVDVRQCVNVDIFQKDANKLAREIHTDIVYMDPPYNSRQYSRFYHVYEVLVKWDKPTLYSDAAKPKFTENNSDYCRTAALEAFTDLIAHIDTKFIVVSYNNTYKSKSSSSENKIKLEQIEEVLNNCGTTKVFTHKHQAFNAGKTDFDDHKEYLFITEVDNEKRNRSFAALLRGRQI